MKDCANPDFKLLEDVLPWQHIKDDLSEKALLEAFTKDGAVILEFLERLSARIALMLEDSSDTQFFGISGP